MAVHSGMVHGGGSPGAPIVVRHSDEYPEPTIDITVDGKTLSVSGDHKASMIKDFMGQFCKPGDGKIRLMKIK